jgi:Zn-dependent peptidase ImmA (M78 family)
MHTVPDDDEKQEDQAHRFAAALLMPAADIKPYLTTPKLSTLARVKAYWKVSIKALIKRAYDLKLITDDQYRWLNVPQHC